jgi:L-2-hydroxyglutarate oxidase
MRQADVVIIGAGIVGLATAYQLTLKFPQLRIVILEKETGLAFHQTGRNSGVLHSGIYYKPGSLKAVNCREGKRALEAFCAAEGIPYEICGKVIVALSEAELPALQMIFDRGQANGVECTMIDVPRLKELEPHAAGIRAIHVPETGIVDYRAVCERLAKKIRDAGDNEIVFSARVVAMERRDGGMILTTGAGDFAARYVVNCAGLHSDRVAALSGLKPGVKIVPFRGEYYELTPEARSLVKNLIYPVPDPAFPFLGVHFTRMIGGSVECGPNAVFAFGREAYRKTDVDLRDLFESLTYSGFIRLIAKYWRIGSGEMWRSISKRAFVRALQRLVPEIRSGDLHPALAGIRAQAIAPDGAMVDDFMIRETDLVVNVCNAPSPAATASLNIGALICDRLARRF